MSQVTPKFLNWEVDHGSHGDPWGGEEWEQGWGMEGSAERGKWEQKWKATVRGKPKQETWS